jgi:ankyrin repeat protein
LRAADKGYEEVLKWATEGSVYLDFTESSDWTPLWLALLCGHKEVVDLLVSNSGVALDSKESTRWTAIWLAVEYEWARGGCEALFLATASAIAGAGQH